MIEKRIAQLGWDDQEALGEILEMLERVERKTDALIEPELRDALEFGIGDLVATLRDEIRR